MRPVQVPQHRVRDGRVEIRRDVLERVPLLAPIREAYPSQRQE
jgi:hypothetical protein